MACKRAFALEVAFAACLIVGALVRIIGAFNFAHDNDFPVFWEAAERAYTDPLSIYHSTGRDDYPQPYTYFPSYAFALAPLAMLYDALALDASWQLLLGHVPVYIGDVGACALLYQILRGKGRAAQLMGVSLYWLSPVVLNGGVHMAHFESIVILFLLLAIKYRADPLKCGLALGISASFKIYGFFLLPVFIMQLQGNKELRTIFELKQTFNLQTAKMICAFAAVPALTVLPYMITDANLTISCIVGHHAGRPADYYTWLGWFGYYSNPFMGAIVFLLDYNVILVGYVCAFTSYWTRRMPLEYALLLSMLAFLFTNKFIYPQYLVVIVPLLIMSGANLAQSHSTLAQQFYRRNVAPLPTLFYIFISVLVLYPEQWWMPRVLVLGTSLSICAFAWYAYEFSSKHIPHLVNRDV